MYCVYVLGINHTINIINYLTHKVSKIAENVKYMIDDNDTRLYIQSNSNEIYYIDIDVNNDIYNIEKIESPKNLKTFDFDTLMICTTSNGNVYRGYLNFNTKIPISNVLVYVNTDQYGIILTMNGSVYMCGRGFGIINENKRIEIPDFDKSSLHCYADEINEKVIDIKGGEKYVVALAENGNVYIWGWGNSVKEQFGNEYTTPHKLNVDSVISIYCGFRHTMLLLKNNTIKLYGMQESTKFH